MAATHVVVRFPNEGTLFGEAIARHPGARMTSILAGRHMHGARTFLDHMALVEGLPPDEIASILLSWERRYGEAPQVLGGPFALRLPIALDQQYPAAASALLRLEFALPDVRHRFWHEGIELWSPCASPGLAERRCAELRDTLIGMPATWIGTGRPRPDDEEAWTLLRSAADQVALDCLVAS